MPVSAWQQATSIQSGCSGILDASEAQAKILEVVRNQPGIRRAFHLPARPSDKELIRAILSAQRPLQALQRSGCNSAQATVVMELLQIAAKAPEPPEPEARRFTCRSHNCSVSCEVLSASFCIIVATALCGAAAVLNNMHPKGWDEGHCSISDFTNADCEYHKGSNACSLTVDVRGGGKLRKKVEWHIPVQLDYKTDVWVSTHEAFRCCNLDDCCGFYNHLTRDFCDHWPHMKDEQGRSCPNGHWPCRYKLQAAKHVSDFNEVLALEVYEPPLTWPMLAVAGVLALFATCLLSMSVWRCLTQPTLRMPKARPTCRSPQALDSCPRENYSGRPNSGSGRQLHSEGESPSMEWSIVSSRDIARSPSLLSMEPPPLGLQERPPSPAHSAPPLLGPALRAPCRFHSVPAGFAQMDSTGSRRSTSSSRPSKHVRFATAHPLAVNLDVPGSPVHAGGSMSPSRSPRSLDVPGSPAQGGGSRSPSRSPRSLDVPGIPAQGGGSRSPTRSPRSLDVPGSPAQGGGSRSPSRSPRSLDVPGSPVQGGASKSPSKSPRSSEHTMKPRTSALGRSPKNSENSILRSSARVDTMLQLPEKPGLMDTP